MGFRFIWAWVLHGFGNNDFVLKHFCDFRDVLVNDSRLIARFAFPVAQLKPRNLTTWSYQIMILPAANLSKCKYLLSSGAMFSFATILDF